MNDETFPNATVEKRANIYDGGGITSYELITESGERKTLGVMQPGRYDLRTGEDDRRIVEIYAGELSLETGDSSDGYGAGERYTVDPNTEFTLDVRELVEYCCTYRS